MIYQKKYLIFLFCFFISLSLSLAQEKINVRAKVKIVEKDGNFLARKSAIQKSYEQAIEKIILKTIPEQTYKDNKNKISDEIYRYAKNYVKDEEIIDEDVQNDEYVINADITIDKKKVLDALNGLNLSTSGQLTEMNLAIAVDEILYNQSGGQMELRTGPKSLIGSQIAEGLLKQKYNLKSEDIIEKIRNEVVGPGGNLSGLFSGKTDDLKTQLAAKMISGEYKIDAIVFGLTKINQAGKDKQGFFTATASTNIRVIETATGNLLASAISNETGIAKTENEAAAAASRRLGQVVSQKITDQLTQKWLDLLNKGSEYEMNFKGLNNAGMKNNLIKLLKEIEGIGKLEEKSWNEKNKALSLKSFYKGKPNQLKENIFRKLFIESDFSGISEEIITGNSLSYSINEPVKKRGIEKETAPPVSFEKPSIRAVIIGVTKYADESMNLNSATADAQIIKDFLSAKDGLNIPDDKIKFITDKDATRANVVKNIKDMFSKSGENDLLILYFAGHGWAEEKEMYFLGHDTNKEDITKTSISQRDIQTALNSAPAKRQIFIADACHSGATSLAYMTYVASSSNDFPVTRSVDPRASFIRNVIGSSTGLAVMTAASANQQSQEGEQWGGGHGIFTWTLLQGLKGEADLNKDKIITINEAFIYSIMKMSQETQGKQTPTVQGPLDLPLGVLK